VCAEGESLIKSLVAQARQAATLPRGTIKGGREVGGASHDPYARADR